MVKSGIFLKKNLWLIFRELLEDEGGIIYMDYFYYSKYMYYCLFVRSAFDLEREREWRQKENALKVQIAQLEATLKADLGEKGGILDKLSIEKGKNSISPLALPHD